ncbi:MAG: preprotein translocase subunit YajC [Alphaproteobacteria bacterium]
MFITPAWAQEATKDLSEGITEAPSFTNFMGPIAPLILIFFIFYVMVIRPQNKRMQEHRRMIDNLEKGDRVVTGGGLIASVRKVIGDDEIELELAPGVIVTAMRSTLMLVRDSAALKRAQHAKDAAKPATAETEKK